MPDETGDGGALTKLWLRELFFDNVVNMAAMGHLYTNITLLEGGNLSPALKEAVKSHREWVRVLRSSNFDYKIEKQLEMTPEVRARWERGADLEARFGLGLGCPPTMTEREAKEWDAREAKSQNIGQKL